MSNSVGNTTGGITDHMHQRRNTGSNKSSANSSYSGHFSNNLEGGRMNGNETNRNILEQQNNDRIAELSDHVARLKGLTIDIGNEVREQNALLDNMGDGFSNTRDLLQGSLRRIGVMLERGGSKHLCYMVGFVVFVMVFLYWVISYKGTNGVWNKGHIYIYAVMLTRTIRLCVVIVWRPSDVEFRRCCFPYHNFRGWMLRREVIYFFP